MTHKRITAKTSGRRSIDVDMKTAHYLLYRLLSDTCGTQCRTFLFSPRQILTQGNSFVFFTLVGIFKFNFFHIFSLSHCWLFLFAGVSFLLLLIFHRLSGLADILYTDSENIAQNLILFRKFFLCWSCDSESFKASSFSTFHRYIAEWLEAFHVV